MDSVSDSGMNVADDVSQEMVSQLVSVSISGRQVARFLEQLCEARGKPHKIICDNGPEYISQSMIDWANSNRITLLYIQPGKTTQNAYIERFNWTAQHEWLELHPFDSVSHAQELATEWLWQYNNERPHTATGGVPPRQLLMTA